MTLNYQACRTALRNIVGTQTPLQDGKTSRSALKNEEDINLVQIERNRTDRQVYIIENAEAYRSLCSRDMMRWVDNLAICGIKIRGKHRHHFITRNLPIDPEWRSSKLSSDASDNIAILKSRLLEFEARLCREKGIAPWRGTVYYSQKCKEARFQGSLFYWRSRFA